MPITKVSLEFKVEALFSETLGQVDVSEVPDISDKRLTHGGSGLAGEFSFLYVDMRGSSDLSSSHRRQTIAKIYKAFHHCMVEAIKAGGGHVRSFDGDRVLGIFGGSTRVDNAVHTAGIMVGCKQEILLPKITSRYQNENFDIGIGISTGPVLAIKAGVGYDLNNRDLVWIGDPPNLGAKLSDEAKFPSNIYVCGKTFSQMSDSNRWTAENGLRKDMWQSHLMPFRGVPQTVYSSTYYRLPQ